MCTYFQIYTIKSQVYIFLKKKYIKNKSQDIYIDKRLVVRFSPISNINWYINLMIKINHYKQTS